MEEFSLNHKALSSEKTNFFLPSSFKHHADIMIRTTQYVGCQETLNSFIGQLPPDLWLMTAQAQFPTGFLCVLSQKQPQKKHSLLCQNTEKI